MGPIFNLEVKMTLKIEETLILVPSKFPEFARFLSDRCRGELLRRSFRLVSVAPGPCSCALGG